jgi:polar amino acid transport system substrate-binding protein
MKKFLLLGLVLVVLGSLMVASTSCSSGPTKLQVVTDATWYPFEYVDDVTGEIVGFDIDIMNAIAERAHLDIEFVNVGWDALLAGMAQGTYDCSISCITITPERAEEMLFSIPYFTAGQIVVVQKDNTTFTSKDDLTGEVGAQLGTTGAMEVEKLSGCTLKNYDEIGLAFQDLMNGQISAVICDVPVARGYVNQNPNELKIIGEMFTTEQYGVAVAKGKEDLLAKINAAIQALIDEGLIDQYALQWLS